MFQIKIGDKGSVNANAKIIDFDSKRLLFPDFLSHKMHNIATKIVTLKEKCEMSWV